MLLWRTTAGNIIDSALKYNIPTWNTHIFIIKSLYLIDWYSPLHFKKKRSIFPDAPMLVKGRVAALNGGKVELW